MAPVAAVPAAFAPDRRLVYSASELVGSHLLQFLAGPWAPPDTIGADPGAEYVLPEVDAVAEKVMTCYDMQVSSRTLITSKVDKGGAIWQIETDRGPRSLKLLHRSAARSLFSVAAQEYLVGQGARVPSLIPTRGGQLCVETGGRLWIVTDWIVNLTPADKIDLAGAQALCYGLGEFHKMSQGYLPPPQAQRASRLYRWPKTYAKILTKMGWFREIAHAYPEMAATPRLLSMLGEFEEQAVRAIARLEQSPYRSLVERGEPYWGLVHQGE